MAKWACTGAKRIQRGLYGGKQVRFGNRISEDGGNRSRRKWLPNVQTKSIFSDTLEKMVRLRVTTSAMRNIDKAGGLDAYLWKIEGGKEDTQMAEKLRALLQDAQQRRLAATAQKAAQAQLRPSRTSLLPAAAAAAVADQGV